MEEYPLGKAVLENPTEFLMKNEERYPQLIATEFENQFETHHFHNRDINIEKKQGDFEHTLNERFITTPTNMASISNVNDHFNVWNLDIYDEELVDKIFGKIIASKVRRESSNDWGPQKTLLEYSGNSIQVTYYPDSIENYGKIKEELNKRKEILQK
jgi:hypothetical protein